LAEVLARFPHPDWQGLDAYLLSWEEERQPTLSQEPPGALDEVWSLQEVTSLALLPTDCPAAVPAYTHYWGAIDGSNGADRLVSAIRSWYKRYAAEPCASIEVTLAFIVGRPPQDIHDAWQLTTEHDRFIKLDDSIRERARALMHSGWWELYDRP
jgi:hypothetical protein